MAFVFNEQHHQKSLAFQAASLRLARLSVEVEEVAALLNDSAEKCECCGSARYRFWAQKQLRDRVIGAVERLREIADVFARRAHDPMFVAETNDPKVSA